MENSLWKRLWTCKTDYEVNWCFNYFQSRIVESALREGLSQAACILRTVPSFFIRLCQAPRPCFMPFCFPLTPLSNLHHFLNASSFIFCLTLFGRLIFICLFKLYFLTWILFFIYAFFYLHPLCQEHSLLVEHGLGVYPYAHREYSKYIGAFIL